MSKPKVGEVIGISYFRIKENGDVRHETFSSKRAVEAYNSVLDKALPGSVVTCYVVQYTTIGQVEKEFCKDVKT